MKQGLNTDQSRRIDEVLAVLKWNEGHRARIIKRRSMQLLGFVGFTAFLPMVLSLLGLAKAMDHKPLLDLSLGARVCMLCESVWLGGILVFLATGIRVAQPSLFVPNGGRSAIFPLVLGLAVLVYVLVTFSGRPYSGKSLEFCPESWELGGGWLLFLWGCVFRECKPVGDAKGPVNIVSTR